MKRSDVKALYFITPIENLDSIIEQGIVCFHSAKKLNTKSIADPIIQKRREKIIPGINKKLHSYANLYFNPRNPMMYKRKDMHQKLCVLRIDPSILEEAGVIITDGNASSDYTRFEPSPSGLNMIDSSYVFTKYWTSDDYFEGLQCKRKICAEVLVPNKIDSHFICGILVSCENSKEQVKEILGIDRLSELVTIKADLFFQ
jgi:hypothetical protein